MSSATDKHADAATRAAFDSGHSLAAHSLRKLYHALAVAIESYTAAIDKLDAPERRGSLASIERDHADALERCGRLLVEIGIQRPRGAKRGAVARLVDAGAAMLGTNTLLKALLRDERRLGELYDEVLQDGLRPPHYDWVRYELMMANQDHVETLERLRDRISN